MKNGGGELGSPLGSESQNRPDCLLGLHMNVQSFACPADSPTTGQDVGRPILLKDAIPQHLGLSVNELLRVVAWVLVHWRTLTLKLQ